MSLVAMLTGACRRPRIPVRWMIHSGSHPKDESASFGMTDSGTKLPVPKILNPSSVRRWLRPEGTSRAGVSRAGESETSCPPSDVLRIEEFDCTVAMLLRGTAYGETA